MKFKKILSLALAAVMCLSLAACGNGGQDAQSGGAETDGVSDAIKSVVLTESWDFSSGFYVVITSANSSNYGAGYWSRNFYNTLVSYNDAGEIQGELAETWDISEDGKTYTFHLREGVKFSDGTALTAQAVKQSFEAAIVNLGDRNGSFGRLTSLIAELEAPDDSTFVMTLVSPYYGALNDATMCMPLAVVNPAAFEGGVEMAYENCAQATMGTGPYMLDSYTAEVYTFVRNPYYWSEAPDVDSFQVKVIADNDAKLLALRSGEIDAIIGSNAMSADGFAELSSDSAFGSTVDDGSNLTRYLGMNLSAAPFDDILVRQAVAYVVDQQELETSVFNGIESAAETLFHSEKIYCDVEQTTYATDVDKAKELMAQAGYVDSDGDGILEKDGVPLAITLSYTQSLASIDDAALTLAAQLKSIGFQVEVEGLDIMTWYGEMMAGTYTVALWYTYGGVYDPFTVMTNMNPAVSVDPIAAQFPSFLEDPSVLDELDSTADFGRVQEIYTMILQTIADQCLIVPVSYSHEMALWDASIIDSYDFTSDANYIQVANIHLAH